MTVDRGGLAYSITVENRFSRALRQFRAEAEQARRAFARLRSESRRGSNTDNTPQSQRAQAREEQIRLRDQARRIRDVERVREQFRRTAVRARREEARANAARIRSAERYRQQLQRAIRQEQRVRAAAARGTQAAVNAVPASAVVNATRLSSTLESASRSSSLLTGSLGRLIAVFAGFAVARAAADGIRTFVGALVDFNAQIEQAELGVATLFTALGTINDNGRTLQGVEALNAAQGIARNQLQQLRLESLRTNASFVQLAETFQVGLAPGLQAGLDIDQVRRFTTQISQAAAAIGVEQNQLAEEIRSVLAGTISARTTRLATALGITNEDIRQARDTGTLFQFLQDRFEAFGVAGAAGAFTFTGALSNVQDAIQQLFAAGGTGLFEELRQLFLDVSEAAIVLGDSISLNPQAVAIIDQVGDALGFAVRQARELFAELNTGDFEFSAQAVAGAIRTTAVILRQIIDGAVRGANDLSLIVLSIRRAIEPLAELEIFDNVDLAAITRIAVIVGGIATAIFTASAAFTALGTVAAGLVGFLTGPVGLVLAIGAAAGGALVLFQQWAESILGARASVLTLARVIRASLNFAIDSIALRFEAGFGDIERLGLAAFQTLSTGAVNLLIAPIREVIRLLASFGVGPAQQALAGLEQGQEAINSQLVGELDARRDINDEIERGQRQLNRILSEDIDRALTANAATSIQGLTEELSGAFSDLGFTQAFDGIIQSIESVGDAAAQSLGFDGAQSALDSVIGRIQSIREALQEEFKLKVDTSDAEFDFGNLEKNSRNIFQLANEELQQGLLRVPSLAQTAIQALNTVVSGFADTAADAIVNAFDPLADDKIDLRERFSQLLRQVARETISTLIRIAIVRATLAAASSIAGSFGSAATGAGGAAAAGAATGGVINADGTVSPLGFAKGTAKVPSVQRPQGLAPSDTVNAWLTPGEAVIRRSSAQKYGYEVMAAINKGLIDPTALRALAGGIRTSTRTSRGPGFNTGGIVAGGQTVPDVSSRTTAPAQPAIAVVAPSEQGLKRLLNGGQSEMLDFMRKNRSAISSALNINERTGRG